MGAARDVAVSEALERAGRRLARTGSPYAVDPGEVRNGSGDPYQCVHAVLAGVDRPRLDRPVPVPTDLPWATGLATDDLPTVPDSLSIPPSGRGRTPPTPPPNASSSSTLADYDECARPPRARCDLAPVARTSSGAASTPGSSCTDSGDRRRASFRKELGWREFYADVLHHRPETGADGLDRKMAEMEVDGAAPPRFDAWCEGRTGHPIVDAGMRQLLAEGWMHNRVRMLSASFLVKDLHLDWRRGARLFMAHLVDGDLASNQHGWQWVAGTGTERRPTSGSSTP